MSKSLRFCLKKLSASMPEASLTTTRQKLSTLQQLTSASSVLAEEMERVTKKLTLPFSSLNPEEIPISNALADNHQTLQQLMDRCSDIVFHELVLGREERPALLLYIEGLADKNKVHQHILYSLTKIRNEPPLPQTDSPISVIKKVFLTATELQEMSTIGEILDTILIGNTALLIDGSIKGLSIATKGWQAREVSEPITEGVVRGPREGFTENLRTNTALLRRKIKSPQLKLENFIIGRLSKTDVTLAYLAGTASDTVLQEVRQRLQRIDVDAILESAYIEELIEDTPYTFFPQIEHSERPDKIAAAVLEGRIAILIDGTPFVLIVPTVMVQFWQSSEDYYERYPVGSLVRLVRFAFSTIALLLPGIYTAVVTHHQELLPTALLISIAGAHEGVPFPIYVEALLMEIVFEILREAGVRLPQPVGQAVSIVGGLVIGDSAVRAGIVSPATIIVVALTGIASFALPSYNFAWSLRLLRFVFGFLGFLSGLYGVMLGTLLLLIHITSLRSFGVPYFSPLAPLKLHDMKDALIKLPLWTMNERPYSIPTGNRIRQKFFLKPRLPNDT